MTPMRIKDILRPQFYTEKAVAYLDNPTSNRYRRARLLAYRAAVMRRAEAAGWRWTPRIEV